MYVPSNCQLQAVLGFTAPATAATTIGLSIEAWLSPGGTNPTPLQSQVFQTNVATAQKANSVAVVSAANNLTGMWVRPAAVQTTASPTGQVQVCLVVTAATTFAYTPGPTFGLVQVSGVAVNLSYVPVAVPSDFSVSTIPWSDTRVVAGELTIQNVTTALNRGGTVTATRLIPEDSSVTGWAASLAASSNERDKVFGPADEPLTAFLLPGSDSGAFYDTTYSLATTGRLPTMSLDNPLPFVALSYSLPGASTLAIQPDWHIEFRTQRALFSLGYSSIPMDVMSRAARRLADIPPIHVGQQKRLLAPTWLGATGSRQTGMATAPPRKQRRRPPRQRAAPYPKPKPKAPPQNKQPKKKGGLQMYLEREAKRKANSAKP
jgi:hypothetical protein